MFCNMHFTSKIDGHFVITIIIILRNRECYNNLQIKISQMTRHSVKTEKFSTAKISVHLHLYILDVLQVSLLLSYLYS